MDVLRLTKQEFHKRLGSHIENIYGKDASDEIVTSIFNIFKDLQPVNIE